MNLFYPSHDIALGNGVKHFNPPKAAQMLQEDLAWLEEIFAHTPSSHIDNQPWGWDWDTRQYLHKERHIPLKQLPTDKDLEALRQLSNRKTTNEILQDLNFDGPMPKYLTSKEDLNAFIEQEDLAAREFVLKTPWSSSGRGLIRSTVTPRDVMRQRAIATIQKMGGIMAEQWFAKSQDFAMLFFVGSEEVSFLGYSLFDNEESGTYRQGYLLSNEEIELRIAKSLSDVPQETVIEQLHAIRTRLLLILNDLFAPFFHLPWQVGYIGIDMMTISPSSHIVNRSSLILHPCVELNLRCTMGVVSRLWTDRHLKPGQMGRFFISPMGQDGHFEAKFEIE